MTTASTPSIDLPVPPDDSRQDIALLMAWLASVGIHVLIFAAMIALPWIRETIGRPDAPDVAATELRDLPSQSEFSMVPTESPFASPVDEKITPTAPILPQQQGALHELTQPQRDDNLAIVGIGTGGGEFARYGLRVGLGDTGPQFFGLGGEARAARKIVYVVDRSGSMLGVFDALKRELKRSLDRLRKSQRYHVIFYSTDPPIEAPPQRLVSAIRTNKARTFGFIDNATPEGMTQPIEAMHRAFQLKPDLIYFLSDGDIPEADALRESLRAWNRAGRVRIFTIAYVSSQGRHLLEEIARDHDGAFRFVSEYELGR